MLIEASLETACGLLFLRALINMVRTISSVSFLLPREVATVPATSSETSRDIILVLPVLHEADRIDGTIKFLSTIMLESRVLECIVVGTELECEQAGSNPTLDAARRSIGAIDRFIVMEAPKSDLGKARQINFAACDAAARHAGRALWLLTIDIDTRFPLDAVRSVEPASAMCAPAVQMHSVFLSGFETLPPIQKAHALYQSRWTVSHEIPNNFIASRTGFYVSHIVGHGAFIKLDLFIEMGGLPSSTHTEDLQFGYYLIASGLWIRSLRLLGMSETPDTFGEALRQQKSWAFGPLHYSKYRSLFKSELPSYYAKNKFRSLIVMMIGMMTFANWLLLFPGLLFVVGMALVGQAVASFILVIYVLELFVVSGLFVRAKWISPIYLILGPVLMLAHVPIRCLAAWRALFHVISRNPIIRSKTVNRSRS